MMQSIHRTKRLFNLRKLVPLVAAAAVVGCGGGNDVEDGRRAPLAVTTTTAPAYDKDDLYRFFAIAFGAAPGVTYMGQLLEAANAGMSIKAIVNVFTTKTQFTDVYPTTLTNQEFATKLVSNVVGSSATAASKTAAVNDIVAALNLPTWTRGDIVFTIFSNLAKKPATDTDWAGTAKKMANQVTYAKYFTETMAVDSVDLPKLRAVVGTVTEASTVTGDLSIAINTAIGQLINSVTPLVFASGYTQFKETAPGSNYYEGGTAEGGKIGFFNGGFNPDLVYNQTLFTGGGYTDQNPNPVPAADTFYYIAVTYSSAPSGGYLGAYSQYPGAGLQLQQQKTLRIDIAVDDGHFKQQTNKDFRVEITAGTTFNNGTCKPMVFKMVTPQQATMYTYRLPLAGFAVAQDCGQANLTAAQILAMPIKEVTALYAYPNLNDSTNVNQYGGRGTAITRGTTAFE